MDDQLLTTAELSAYLKISKSKTFELVHQDGFPSWKIGRKIFVKASDLDKWIEEQKRMK